MAFRAAALGNDGITAATTSCAITVPTSGSGGTVAAGDVAVVFLDNNGAAGITFSPPTSDGWTSRSGPDNTGNSINSQIYTKTLAAADLTAVKTFTTSSSGRFQGVMIVLSGVAESSIIVPAYTFASAAGTSLTTPTVTTTAANSDVLELLALRSGSTTSGTVTAPAGYTLDATSKTGVMTAPTLSAIGLHLTTPGAAGSYGGSTITASVAVSYTAYTIAFAPAPTAITVADTGSGADALAVAANIPVGDTATGTDALAVTSATSLGDTAIGGEALAVSVGVPLTDTGAGVDGLAVAAATALPDAATAADQIGIAAGVPLADAAAVADTLTVAATAAVTDSAASTDNLTVAAGIPLADTATAADQITTLVLADHLPGLSTLTANTSQAALAAATGIAALPAQPIGVATLTPQPINTATVVTT